MKVISGLNPSVAKGVDAFTFRLCKEETVKPILKSDSFRTRIFEVIFWNYFFPNSLELLETLRQFLCIFECEFVKGVEGLLFE